MLTVDALETAYGVSQVLFGVSFAVAPGQVVTLLGRNGMGKTTTVRSIMGIARPRAGAIHFEGRPLHGLPPYRVAQAGVGLVPEGRQIFPNLTVRENLVAMAGNRGGSREPWRVEMVFGLVPQLIESGRVPAIGSATINYELMDERYWRDLPAQRVTLAETVARWRAASAVRVE